MNTSQLVYEMALVLVASRKPLADARTLRGILRGATFRPEEIAAHFGAALARAGQIKAEGLRR